MAEPKHWLRQLGACDSHGRCIQTPQQWAQAKAKENYRTKTVEEISNVAEQPPPHKHEFSFKNSAEYYSMLFAWDDKDVTKTAGNTRLFLEFWKSCTGSELPLCTEADRLAALDAFSSSSSACWPKSLTWPASATTISWSKHGEALPDQHDCRAPVVCRQSVETWACKCAPELAYVLAGSLPARCDREKVK